VDAPRGRRIWHFETEALCNALNETGAWQTAVRVRVAHDDALRHRPDGTAFDLRPTPEDVAPLNLAPRHIARRARTPEPFVLTRLRRRLNLRFRAADQISSERSTDRSGLKTSEPWQFPQTFHPGLRWHPGADHPIDRRHAHPHDRCKLLAID
jgi:hypothetical protein